MLEFIAGVFTGAILFGGKKESDAEAAAKRAAQDRKRAAATMAKDLSHLLPVREGAVDKVELVADDRWIGNIQIVSFAGWKVALPSKADVYEGCEIRVVDNVARIDGHWYDVVTRTTKARAKLNMAISFAKLAMCAAMLWCGWEFVQELWGFFVGLFSGHPNVGGEPVPLIRSGMLRWGMAMISCFVIMQALDAVPAGLPGLWKVDSAEGLQQ